MTKTIPCKNCPNGCEITVETDGEILVNTKGANCSNGLMYVEQVLFAPVKIAKTFVKVEGGEKTQVNVTTNEPIPKSRLFDVIKAAHKMTVKAPIHAGQIVIQNVLGLGVDFIAETDVPKV